MAAIVRIKRRRDEDPQDLLLLSCKKQKSSNDGSLGVIDDHKTVFKFAGTVLSKDDAVSKPVREAIRKEKLEKEFKQHQVNTYGGIRQQTRQEQRQSSQKNRYKVISNHRVFDLDSLDEIDENVKVHSEAKQTDEKNELSIQTVKKETGTCKIIGSIQQCNDVHESQCTCYSVDTDTDTIHKDMKSSDKECVKTLEKQSAEKSSVDECASEKDRKVYCLLDVETDMPSYQSVLNQSTSDQITCNSEPMKKEIVSERGSDDDYVYDLYFLNNRDFDYHMLENGLTLEAFTDDNIYTGGLSDDEEFIYEDEDDENDENNWRNDYPDEDPGFIENDGGDEFYGEGLQEVHAFESGQDHRLSEWMSWRCNKEDNNELSSDDDDVERYEAGRTHSSGYYRHVGEIDSDMDSDDGTVLPDL